MGVFDFINLVREVRAKGGIKNMFKTASDGGAEALEATWDAAWSIPRIIIRVLQFVFGLVVIGMYGNRVDNDRKAGNSQAAAWVYAVLVAGLSCVGAVLLLGSYFASTALKFFKKPGKKGVLPSPKNLYAFDLLLFILWIAVFGTFAAIFRTRTDKEYQGTSVRTMKVAYWIDLVNCIFWLISGVYGCAVSFMFRKGRALKDRATNKAFDEVSNFSGEVQMRAMEKVYQQNPKAAEQIV